MLVPKEICDQYNDREIIQRSLADIDFFSCLYERYEARLLRYIGRVGAFPEGEAQDILQESFIKIWKNLHAFDPKLKFSSWIYRIVHNEAISCLRKKRAYGKDRKVDLDDPAYPAASVAETDAEANAIALNDQDLLAHEVLEQLALPYKEVLVLKFLEGMSYEEISDVLKIPEGTVATRINRAKKAFRKLSAEQQLSFEL